jgi:hypothetical protein
MEEPRTHWDRVYKTKSETEVSWYQRRPDLSLALIRSAAPDLATPILDVGGGASTLVDELLLTGYTDLTVLDISSAALACSKARLTTKVEKVAWIVTDITAWDPSRVWGLWHDRAVFHFLTLPAQQDAYVATLEKATAKEASIIMATFAPDGPERCSGLPVQRYSPQSLAARLGAKFELVREAAEQHVTPGGARQSFAYSVFKRR